MIAPFSFFRHRLTQLSALAVAFILTVAGATGKTPEQPKLVAHILSAGSSYPAEENANIFWSKGEIRIERADGDHATLLKISSLPRTGQLAVSGQWAGTKKTRISDGSAKLKLRPQDHHTAVLLHSVTMYLFETTLQPTRSRRAVAVRQGSNQWVFQPGLGQTSRMVVQHEGVRLEVRLAPPGQRFIPARLSRPMLGASATRI